MTNILSVILLWQLSTLNNKEADKQHMLHLLIFVQLDNNKFLL